MSSTLFYYEPLSELDRLLHIVRKHNGGSNVVQHYTPRQAPFLNRSSMTLTGFIRMDLHQDVQNNTVTATIELPGLNKDNVHIDVHDSSLNISGETKLASEQEEIGYAVRERKYGKFSRRLQLPRGVRVSNAMILFGWRRILTELSAGGRNQSIVGGWCPHSYFPQDYA
jgi:HSP20 family protein